MKQIIKDREQKEDSGSAKDDDRYIMLHEKDAKRLFKILRGKGFLVDVGRTTGNIYSPGDRRKLTWMLKDLQGNWVIEKLFENVISLDNGYPR